MNFKLKDIEIHNFRSWKHFYLNFENLGLTLLKGVNGSGKSSVRHAIEIVLTNKTTDNISVDELSYNKSGNYKIKAHLLRGNDFITIVNKRKKGKLNIQLFVNGEQLTENDSRETQKKITQLLGLDKSMLSCSNVFSFNSYSFTEASEKERKDIIYDILDLHKYTEYYNKIKKKIRDAENLIIKHDSMLDVLYADLDRIKLQINEFTEKSKTFSKDTENKVIELKSELDKLNNIKYEFNEIDLNKKESIKSELSEINKKLAYWNLELENIKKEHNGICPILNEECDRIGSKCDDRQSDIEKSILELLKLYDNKELEFNAILNSEKENVKIETEQKVNQSKIKNIKDKIEEVKKTNNHYNDLIEDAEKLLLRKKEKIGHISNFNKDLLDKLKYFKFWEVGFSKSGIPNKISDDFLDSLEYETNKYLSDFGSNIIVDIDSQHKKKDKSYSEKISYKVSHPEKTITDYKSYSSGQRQRIKIADLLAFNNLLGNFNFIVFDEILDISLDGQGKQDVIDILKSKSKELDTILVISHSTQIQDIFDSVIDIDIEDGVSYVK